MVGKHSTAGKATFTILKVSHTNLRFENQAEKLIRHEMVLAAFRL
jgi:hypothetical protein